MQTLIPFSCDDDKPVWYHALDGDDSVRSVFDRHYSRYHYKDGRKPKLFVGPGQKMVLRTWDCDAIFAWRKFISDDGQQGLNCAIFRNESMSYRSSDLILLAEIEAMKRWTDNDRFYTYVNPRSARSKNPGYCFICAGWKKCGVTKVNKLIIMEKRLQ